MHAGSIPVIASLGETAGGQILNINADFAANELVVALQPYKIVFLTGTGGLLDDWGNVIDSINLATEYEHLMAQPWLQRRHAREDRADQGPARQTAADLVGVDHQAGRTRQGIVHASRLRHLRAARREGAARDFLGADRPQAHALSDRVELRSRARRRTTSKRRSCCAPTSARTIAPRSSCSTRDGTSISTSSPCSTTRRAKASAARSGR